MEDILTRVENRIGVLTFNRPEVMNAVAPPYLLRVIDAFAKLEADPEVRVIIVTGAGKSFCSGGDRGFLDGLTRTPAHEIRDTVYASFQGVARAFKLSAKPTIAAVNGPAIGAGCEFAVACDFRVTTPKAFFCENWIDIGIMPPLGGLFLLPRLIGLERASNMVMRATRVYGEEAVRIGLATECVEEAELMPAAMKIAGELADRPQTTLRIIKQGLRRGMNSTLESEWEFNVPSQAILLNSPDFREAVAAIGEKRKPKFG